MKNQYIIVLAITLLATGSALAATTSATSSDPKPVEDQQVAKLIGLINNRFPDSVTDLKTVTVHVNRSGQMNFVQLVPRQNNVQTGVLRKQLRQANLGVCRSDCKEKRIKLTFVR
jgi:hypothetical protein